MKKDLLLSFLKIGLLGFGGGSAVAPLIHDEAVTNHHWITDEEFIDILAVSNSLPGPSMVQIASSIGYTVAGDGGMYIAAISIITPMTLMFVLIMLFLNNYIDMNIVSEITTPILPVISAFMASLAVKFFKNIKSITGVIKPSIIIIVSFLLLSLFSIHPSLLIIGMIIIVGVLK